MSGRLVSAVFASALPPWLKPVAAAYASFAHDDGSCVFPKVKTIAGMVGRQERQTRSAAVALRQLGVLVVVRPATPRLPFAYRFNETALPTTLDDPRLLRWQAAARLVRSRQKTFVFDFSTGFSTGDPQKPSTLSRFPQFAQAGVQPTAPLGCSPLHPDPSIDPSTYSSYTRTRRSRGDA